MPLLPHSQRGEEGEGHFDRHRPCPVHAGPSYCPTLKRKGRCTTPASCVVIATPTPTMSATLTTLKIRTARLALPTAARQFSTSSPRFYRRQPGDPTGPNEPPTHISAPKSKSPLKVWPILAIFGIGTFLFKKIVDQRDGQYKPTGPIAGHSPSSKPATPEPTTRSPTKGLFLYLLQCLQLRISAPPRAPVPSGPQTRSQSSSSSVALVRAREPSARSLSRIMASST